MIALMRQVADCGDSEGALWVDWRIHRVASEIIVNLGYSSKLNAEWDFLCMLRDTGRRSVDPFLEAHAADLGRRSTYDLDTSLKSV